MREEKGTLERLASRHMVAALALGSFCLIGVATVEAQVSASTLPAAPPRRLLTAREGRVIAAAAWNQLSSPRGTRDCSHVVHQIYSNAGFQYAYASSTELYAGSNSFARVKYPRAGDLIVWSGHMGIVADPLKHSFYSLISTGFEEQDFEAPYWRSRGRPHFYRYRVQNPVVLSAAKLSATPPISSSSKQQKVPAVMQQQSFEEISPPGQQLKTASEQTAIYGPPVPPELASGTPAFEMPSSILVVAGRKPPTREEVAEAISALNNTAGDVLRSNDPFKLQLPVLIVEKLSVERVDIKRDHGWAQLQIDSKACIGCPEIQKAPRQSVRWELRRTDSGWEAVTPSDRTYVSHDAAIKNLAAQLARLTQSDGADTHQEAVLRQESQLANLLSALLTTN